MREIIFDTETTGLDSREDRIIEIGGLELERQFPTGRTFHVYINPGERKVHPDALAVHGITDAFLKDKPVFADIVTDMLAFFGEARWVAHNATFDMGFINAELQRLGHAPITNDRVTDTLSLARRKHPMGPNSLDALCRRYGIDNSHRTKHGALLDSELLAEVYIEMLGGRQAALGLTAQRGKSEMSDAEEAAAGAPRRLEPLASRLDAGQIEAHDTLLKRIGEKALWNRYRDAL